MATGHEEKRAANEATFLIAPGHSTDGDVIAQHDHYLVVRKHARGGEVARALDPRKEEV